MMIAAVAAPLTLADADRAEAHHCQGIIYTNPPATQALVQDTCGGWTLYSDLDGHGPLPAHPVGSGVGTHPALQPTHSHAPVIITPGHTHPSPADQFWNGVGIGLGLKLNQCLLWGC